jgi:hypothetical protein
MSLSKILFEGGVSDILFTDRRQFYLEENQVHEYYKNLTPWLTWLNMLGTQKTDDPLYKMFEDTPTFQSQYFYVNGTATTIAANGAESSNITIDNIHNLTYAATVDQSMENIVVEIWDSTGTTKKGQAFIYDASGTYTVTMKTLKGTAITTADDDICRVIGTVRGEKSVAPVGYYNELSVVWNSTHDCSKALEVTGKLAKETRLKGASSELARLRAKKLKEAKYDAQNILLKSSSTLGTNFTTADTFSEASLRSAVDVNGNSSAARTTYGYIPILEDYGTTWSGTGDISSVTNIFKLPVASLDFPQFSDIFQVIFDKREEGIIPGFCGYSFLGNLAKRVANKKFGFEGQVQIGDQKINQIGFDVRNVTTPFGTVQLIPTKMLDNEYANYCLLPNQNEIGIVEYEGWDYQADIKKDDGYNGIKDMWNWNGGLKMNLLATHHIIALTA